MRVLPKQLPIRFGSYPGAGVGQPALAKPWGQKSAKGGPANVRAVTRVNSEQASKVQLWMPSRLRNGEGLHAATKESAEAVAAIHRGSGDGTYGRLSVQRGRSAHTRGRGPRQERSFWCARKSERPIVLQKRSNVRGGKGPYFWVLTKQGTSEALA